MQSRFFFTLKSVYAWGKQSLGYSAFLLEDYVIQQT